MEERLQVRIEADIKNFQSGMSQVENNLKRAEGIFQTSSRSAFQLENAIATLSREFKEGAISNNNYQSRLATLNSELSKQRANVSASAKEVSRLNAEMKRVEAMSVVAANNRASKSFDGLATSVRGSRTAGLSFNQMLLATSAGSLTARGSLYQLSTMFDYLGRSATTAGSSVRAGLTAMVTGPNLALLAISALTAGITAYNMGAFDFLKANESKKKSLEDLRKELDKYRATLSTVQQQSIVGAQNAQQELATLDALAAQARNTALSNEQRNKAVEELQKKYPSYLGNLTDEQIKTGDVSEEMYKLRTNLIETAKAYAMIDKVRENSIALLDLEARALTRAQEIREKVEEIASNRERDRSGAANINATISRQNRLQQELNSILEEQTADYNKIREIQSENESLQQRTNQALEAGGNLVKETAENMERLKKAIPHAGDLNFKVLADISQSFKLDDKEVDKQFADLIKRTQDKIAKDDTSFVNVPVKLDFTPETLGADAQEQNDAIVEQWKARMEAIQGFGNQIERTLSRSFEQSIMSGDNFFDAVQQGFKRMLAKLAAQLAASAVIKVLGMIVGGPAGGALAGGASMGLGALFGGSNMRIGQTPAIGSPTGGSSSAGYRVDVNVHGVVRGSDLYLANQRSNRNNERYY